MQKLKATMEKQRKQGLGMYGNGKKRMKDLDTVVSKFEDTKNAVNMGIKMAKGFMT